jgi:hypothetical protein
MNAMKDKQAEHLSIRLREIGVTRDPTLTDEDYAMLQFAGGYLAGLASRIEELERDVLARYAPPHCETCICPVKIEAEGP